MKKTIRDLLDKKGKSRVTCLTAYDYSSATIIDTAGVDIMLVGDSLGMVVQGEANTLGVTLEHIIYHTQMVVKAAKSAFVVADMPFGSINSISDGIENAVTLIKQTGADAVKLEGGDETVYTIIKELRRIGILTVGHIGLQPQQVIAEGGYKLQGYDNEQQLMEQALALQNAGAVMIVLEAMEPTCAANITSALKILTIGIGAGVACDGQVLVFHDIFGFSNNKTAKFVKKYANVYDLLISATTEYIKDVETGTFPSAEYTYKQKNK